jgi:hypothetical protein
MANVDHVLGHDAAGRIVPNADEAGVVSKMKLRCNDLRSLRINPAF